MIRFAADEDFDNDILRALRRRLPEVDVFRIHSERRVAAIGCRSRLGGMLNFYRREGA